MHKKLRLHKAAPTHMRLQVVPSLATRLIGHVITAGSSAPLFCVVLACFISSAGVLGLYRLQWAALVNGVMWTSLFIAVGERSAAIHERVILGLCPLLLCVLSLCVNQYLAAMLTAAWLYALSSRTSDRCSLVLKQFSYALVLFEIVDLLLLKRSPIDLWMSDYVHAFTRLIRESRGGGEIGGLLQIDYGLLVFAIVATLPLACGQSRHLLLALCQVLASVLDVPIRSYFGPMIALMLVVVSACGLICHLVRDGQPRDQESRSNLKIASRAVRLASILFLLAVFIATNMRHHATRRPENAVVAKKSESNRIDGFAKPILFVNDRAGIESDNLDMTDFRRPSPESPSSMTKRDALPRYNTLASSLLPALGYRVDVRSIDQLGPGDYADYKLVVLICLQRLIPSDHRKALYTLIDAGTTNVLIAGDHTDIRGVRGPFNDFMSPMGVVLNYDSAIPFGQWSSQIIYTVHPVNGARALAPIGAAGDPQVSVGASLTIAGLVTRPLLVAGDGFADRGTPDAPMHAGLGDMVYNDNEVRGGLVLAAERSFGRGKVIAFGDTALFQNGSIATNFAYIAALFEYLTRDAMLTDTVAVRLAMVASGVVIAITLAFNFSLRDGLACIVLLVATSTLHNLERSHRDIVSELDTDLVVVDDCHGEMFQSHEKEKSIHTVQDIIEHETACFPMCSNALSLLDLPQVKCIVLLGPRAALTDGEQQRLIQFVSQGGSLILAAGFYEAREHQQWLNRFGCRVSPIVLGGGQQVTVQVPRFGKGPNIVEAWALDLEGDWRRIITCYEKPVVASRTYGRGRICIISDSFVLLDGNMGEPERVHPESRTFLSEILHELALSKTVPSNTGQK